MQTVKVEIKNSVCFLGGNVWSCDGEIYSRNTRNLIFFEIGSHEFFVWKPTFMGF
jgi:hypothetical protein